MFAKSTDGVSLHGNSDSIFKVTKGQDERDSNTVSFQSVSAPKMFLAQSNEDSVSLHDIDSQEAAEQSSFSVTRINRNGIRIQSSDAPESFLVHHEGKI